MQTDVFSKFQVTLTHRLFTQSFQLCFSNVETAGAYLSRENISFWKAISGVEGSRRPVIFFPPFHEHVSFLKSFVPKLKMLFVCLEITAVGTGRSLVSRLVHIPSLRGPI